MDIQRKPLSFLTRLYIYGAQGMIDEIMFTSIYDAFLEPKGNHKLLGYTSLFSWIIYGTCSMAVEQMYSRVLKPRNVPLVCRVLIFTAMVYLWELIFGLILDIWGLRSWDYSHYPLNFLGIITLVYAPFWMFLSYLQDLLQRYLLNIGHMEHDKTL